MCGIFGFIGKKCDVSNLVLDGLKTLEYRGYDSWGVAISDNKKLFLKKQTGKIGNAKIKVIQSNSGLGHTRWATHGGVTISNAHPHLDCSQNIIVVHNVIVENYNEIKSTLSKNHHKFKSETDTEIIPHLIESKINNGSSRSDAVLTTFKELQGMSAIIVFFIDSNEMFAIKNGSPIVFGFKDKQNFIASDVSAMIDHTKRIYFLNDNELLHITTESYKLYNLKKEEIKLNLSNLNYDLEAASIGRYKHFLLKEIEEQPKILANILKNHESNLREFARVISEAYGTFLIGCGTAGYAGMAATYLFSKIARKHINFSIASEFNYQLDFIKPTSLIIALSQSGETIDLISSIKHVKSKGAKIASLTNARGSTLYRMSDHRFLLNAGPEKAVLSTKAYSAKVATLFLVAHLLNYSYKDGVRHIENAIESINRILHSQEQIKKLAKLIKHHKHLFVLGRGISYTAALEAALKIKECTYIHAEGFAAGELKHGVIALIEKGTPVIVFNPDDETYDDTLSSAHEVKARGAMVIGISNKPNNVFDEFISIEDCGDATILVNVVIAQLLTYYLAIELERDPDKPRNLAKSVVVK